MCIKPSADGGSVGVARLLCAEDLAVYSDCLREREVVLPELALTWDNLAIPMPLQRPASFVVEPYIPADR